MKKHEELFMKEHSRMKELLSTRESELVLYGLIGGLGAVIENSKSDKIAISDVIKVYKLSIDNRLQEREKRAKGCE